jgi:DnaJ-class molecular chaperone
MGIFQRLYKILRSNLSPPPDLSDTINQTEDKWDKYFENGSTDYQTPEKIDPRLAGYFANLEIPYGSDLETATRAWKKMLKKYHPDLHSNNTEKKQIANELVQGLNRAYEEIKKYLEKK